jgi:hypothetical protein
MKSKITTALFCVFLFAGVSTQPAQANAWLLPVIDLLSDIWGDISIGDGGDSGQSGGGGASKFQPRGQTCSRTQISPDGRTVLTYHGHEVVCAFGTLTTCTPAPCNA